MRNQNPTRYLILAVVVIFLTILTFTAHPRPQEIGSKSGGQAERSELQEANEESALNEAETVFKPQFPLRKSSTRYGYGLKETGSEKSAYTIFTNPGQDCSTEMNISWATPPGKKWLIEVVDENTKQKYIYDYDEESLSGGEASDTVINGKKYKFPYQYLCDTYDNKKSKLSNGDVVYERHIFDKHGFELYDLEPNTEYRYRIITFNDSTGIKEYSEPRYFITAGAPSWKAAIIGDFHHYSPAWKRLDSAMGMIDVLDSVADGVDWVLSTGDQCAWGGSYNFWTELSEQPAFKDFMWASVQGNHDNMTSNSEKSDAFFRDSHYFPWNGYEGQEGVTYWFRYGDVLFLMLNNEAMLTKGSVEPVYRWMEKVIKENPSKYVVVVEHHQWLIGTSGTNGQLDRFREIFDRLGVDLAISGHNHVYLRTYPLRDRQPVEPQEGTYYVVNSSSDDSRGRDMKSLADNKDIIAKRWSEGSHTIGGMVMDVNPRRIQMTLYDRYGTVQDTFEVPAKR